jgi:hypothetical protein
MLDSRNASWHVRPMSSTARRSSKAQGDKPASGKRVQKARAAKPLVSLRCDDVIVPERWGERPLPKRTPVIVGGEPLSRTILAERR